MTTTILDLPVELVLDLFSYLDVNSFLNLTATCKPLHNPEFAQDARYWSSLTRNTFRVPNQPVIEQDGERWQKLFKRMLTQSRIYTWGNNEKSCLGHSFKSWETLQHVRPPGVARVSALRKRHISWPEQMHRVEELGVISDIQCGGWSTSLLTAKGALYTVGVIDGLQMQRRAPHMQKVMQEPVPLQYPPGFPPPYDRYDASTAVKQFSSGRAHILAVSDSGRIWSWQNIEHAALHVKFLSHDVIENGRNRGLSVARKVVAGWNKSAALVEGTGIVLWQPLRRSNDPTETEDTVLVVESGVVPNTDFRRNKGPSQSHANGPGPANSEAVGEVTNFIVLEEVVLFNTHLGKVFVSRIDWSNEDQRMGDLVELQVPEDAGLVTDIQGSFQNFAVFTQSGAVLTGKQDRVQDLVQGQLGDKSLFTRIPALQHKDVIQLAFGDWHFHALHASGYITSYGTESQHCGALGLGGQGGGEGRIRGIRYSGAGGDGRLIPHAYAEGRRIWFEREKRAWIKFIVSGGVDPAESMERVRMAIGSPGIRCQGEVSEWIEQEGRDWEKKFGVKGDEDDGLGAYFAMSVTAAGWHSGALVLVNEDLAERLKRACEVPDPASAPTAEPELSGHSPDSTGEAEAPQGLVSWLFGSAVSVASDYGRWFLGMSPYNAAPPPEPESTEQMNEFRRGTHPLNYGASPRVGFTYRWANDHFPRLQLSDGVEMPGMVPFEEWRYERPEWDLDFAL